ncbi:MAG TPA: endonuclease NucS domain-containing protein, partial [Prolixibacteraceae bacterium]|nr:endonuclease NucS domain-containing protein [Prolixibacteraceae bacterium]
KFGYEQHGRFRAAIQKYFDFFTKENILSTQTDLLNSDIIENDDIIEKIIESSFTYEKDLQKSLCQDVEKLFPDYKIFGENKEGIEFSVNGKRIDILLSHTETGDLLAVELKSGLADFKVFGQISMYIGLLKSKFPDKNIKGLIIAGSIDDSLTFASSTNNLISLKTYKMKLQLEDVHS